MTTIVDGATRTSAREQIQRAAAELRETYARLRRSDGGPRYSELETEERTRKAQERYDQLVNSALSEYRKGIAEASDAVDLSASEPPLWRLPAAELARVRDLKEVIQADLLALESTEALARLAMAMTKSPDVTKKTLFLSLMAPMLKLAQEQHPGDVAVRNLAKARDALVADLEPKGLAGRNGQVAELQRIRQEFQELEKLARDSYGAATGHTTRDLERERLSQLGEYAPGSALPPLTPWQ